MSGIDESFANLRGAFPTVAEFQGLHFKYVVKEGVVLIEQRLNVAELMPCRVCGGNAAKDFRYFYWLLVGDRFKLVHASNKSKLKRLQPISDSTFTPSHAYDANATA